MKQIDKLVAKLTELRFRLIRATSGKLYIVTHSHETGRTLSDYDPRNKSNLAKWLLRRDKVEFTAAALAECVEYMAMQAETSPPVETSVRVAEREGLIYVDLCDQSRRVVRITRDGWEVVKEHPVYFLRPSAALPQPEPTRGGSVEALRKILGITDDGVWVLVLGWLCAAFKEKGAHMLLALEGAPGSGKSTLTKLLARLIDPREPQTMQMQFKSEDTQLTAGNRWILALDEVDGLSKDKARTVAALCTGAGLERKKNYSDTETVAIAPRRPVILNGHDGLLTEERIRDRAVPLVLPRLPESQRADDSQLEDRMKAATPEILGGLFTILSQALGAGAGADEVGSRIRMSEAGRFADRCVQIAGFPAGAFTLAVQAAQNRVTEQAAEDWVLLAPLTRVAKAGFSGNMISLLETLSAYAGTATKDAQWPKSAEQLGKVLNAHAGPLSARGIAVERKPKGRQVTVSLVRTGAEPEKSGPLKTLSPEVISGMQARYARMAQGAGKTPVAFEHGDGSFTLFGEMIPATAKKLNREVADGPSLRVSYAEWEEAVTSEVAELIWLKA